ncbi:MAG TPA: hypothetical protein VGG25_14200 [Streptosporangiaceae bacterium]
MSGRAGPGVGARRGQVGGGLLARDGGLRPRGRPGGGEARQAHPRPAVRSRQRGTLAGAWPGLAWPAEPAALADAVMASTEFT